MNYNTGWITGTGIVLVSTNGSGVNAPAAPTNLNALAVSNTRINLTWSDTNTTETGFKIQRSTNAGGTWILKDSVPANTLTYADTGLTANTIYHYRIYAYNIGGNSPFSNIAFDTTLNLVGISQIGNGIPKTFKLYNNYPNPFNPSTVIYFDIPKQSFTRLVVYDILGKEISELVNEQLSAGTYNVNFSGINLPSGVYFYRLEADDFVGSKKMVLAK